jgi:hypothetical protein
MREVFNTFKIVIEKGNYDLTALLEKINTYHIEGEFTDEERTELCSLARKGANVSNSADVFAKLAELEKRIITLEQSKTDNQDEVVVDEFKVGKWYYNGDKMLFEGEIHICTAPEGVVCVWSPKEYPDYWEMIK